MKKCLYILLVLQILVLAVSFFVLLQQSVLLASIFAAVNVLTVVLTYAVISNMNNIEDLWDEINRQRSEIKRLTDKYRSEEDVKAPYSVVDKESARGVWECVKCGTVNKEGTMLCSNCKAEYSSWVNPTDNPYKKKKLSRWVK